MESDDPAPRQRPVDRPDLLLHPAVNRGRRPQRLHSAAGRSGQPIRRDDRQLGAAAQTRGNTFLIASVIIGLEEPVRADERRLG